MKRSLGLLCAGEKLGLDADGFLAGLQLHNCNSLTPRGRHRGGALLEAVVRQQLLYTFFCLRWKFRTPRPRNPTNKQSLHCSLSNLLHPEFPLQDPSKYPCFLLRHVPILPRCGEQRSSWKQFQHQHEQPASQQDSFQPLDHHTCPVIVTPI